MRSKTKKVGMIGLLLGAILVGLPQPTAAADDSDCGEDVLCEDVFLELSITSVALETENTCDSTENVEMEGCAGASASGPKIFWAFTGVDYEGTEYYAYGDKCLDGDGANYGIRSFPDGADNNLESGVSVGNCWVLYFTNTKYDGSSWWCKEDCPNFGTATNTASSAKLY